jgi:hypothetical protein
MAPFVSVVQITLVDAELFQHAVERARFQLVLQVAHYRPLPIHIRDPMTTFASIRPPLVVPPLPLREGFEPFEKIRYPSSELTIGHFCPIYKPSDLPSDLSL